MNTSCNTSLRKYFSSLKSRGEKYKLKGFRGHHKAVSSESCEGWKGSATSAKSEFHILEEHRDVKSPHSGLCSETTSLLRKSVRKQFKSTDEQNVGVK